MKQFIVKVLFYLLPACCVYGCYLTVQQNDTVSGDLGELGQIPFGKEYDQNLKQNYLVENLVQDTLISYLQKLKFRNSSTILTIGDSFSQINHRYQNYLAYLFDYKVINIKRNNNVANPIEDAVSLLNSEIIDSATCQLIIIETCDRYTISRLAYTDYEHHYDMPEKKKNPKEENINENISLYNFCSWIRLQVGYSNPVLKYDLNQPCFTHSAFSNTLFCYQDDMLFKSTTNIQIEQAERNLALLNKKFADKGIKLIFLIAADKYDVYRPMIKDDDAPIDTTTDGLTNVPNVCVINTKPMLQAMVQSGEQDVYLVNDSHWSYKASETVARKIFENLPENMKRN
jgi:hypothetical protein